MELTVKNKDRGFLSPLWNDFFNGERLFDRWPLTEPVFSSPPANVIENGNTFRIELAVPGFAKKDFQVTVDDRVLSVTAEKEDEREEDDDRYTRKEFRYTSFARAFTLPQNCDEARIEARYSDGILTLVIPKKENGNGTQKKEIRVN